LKRFHSFHPQLEDLCIRQLCLNLNSMELMQRLIERSENLFRLELSELQLPEVEQSEGFFKSVSRIYRVELKFKRVSTEFRIPMVLSLLGEYSQVGSLTIWSEHDDDSLNLEFLETVWIDNSLDGTNCHLFELISPESDPFEQGSVCRENLRRNAFARNMMIRTVICMVLSDRESVLKDFKLVGAISDFLFSEAIYNHEKRHFSHKEIPLLLANVTASRKRKSTTGETSEEPPKRQRQEN
jgi:hypothetical protein